MTNRHITTARMAISNVLDLTDSDEAGLLELNPITGTMNAAFDQWSGSGNNPQLGMHELTSQLQAWLPASTFVTQDIGGFNSQAIQNKKGPQNWECVATFVQNADVALHLLTGTPGYYLLHYDGGDAYELNVVVELQDVRERWDRQLSVALVDVRFVQAGKQVVHYT